MALLILPPFDGHVLVVVLASLGGNNLHRWALRHGRCPLAYWQFHTVKIPVLQPVPALIDCKECCTNLCQHLLHTPLLPRPCFCRMFVDNVPAASVLHEVDLAYQC